MEAPQFMDFLSNVQQMGDENTTNPNYVEALGENEDLAFTNILATCPQEKIPSYWERIILYCWGLFIDALAMTNN